jgi:hypothetical protein
MFDAVTLAAMLRLYRPRDIPDHLVGEDRAGALLLFPATARGWAKRTPYTGPKKALDEVKPSEGRRTGWPGAIGGKPRSETGKPSAHSIGVRVTDDERAAWEHAAGDMRLSDWIRATLNDAATAARRGKAKP